MVGLCVASAFGEYACQSRRFSPEVRASCDGAKWVPDGAAALQMCGADVTPLVR
jgi:hypothetical protein